MTRVVKIEGFKFVGVRLLPDGRFWYAEGVSLDYGAQGDSIEDALANFKRGFEATIRLHIERFGKFDPEKFKYKEITVVIPEHIVNQVWSCRSNG